jgi:signal transduction histidine kinase
LGLAIVREIAQMHDAGVWIEDGSTGIGTRMHALALAPLH